MKYNWIILLVLFFGILTKLAGVFLLPFIHDLGIYLALYELHDSAYMNLIAFPHPPIAYYFYFFIFSLLGVKDYTARAVPFIFSLIEIYLIYKLAHKFYNEETAKNTVLLWALTFFAYVNAVNAEVDGSIMSVMSIGLFYFFYQYFQTREKRCLLFAGLFFGLLLLTRIRAVIFILPLVLYAIYSLFNKNNTLKETVMAVTMPAAIGLAVFSLFPLTVYLTSPQDFIPLLKNVFMHGTSSQASIIYKITHPLLFLQLFVVISPLYIFLYFNELKNLPKKSHDILFHLWFSSIFLAFIIALPAGTMSAVYPRYISFLLPPFILLSAKSLTSLRLSKTSLIFVLILSAATYMITHKINESANDYWYYASAPIGVYKITQPILVFYTAAAFILWLFYTIVKIEKVKRVLIAAFLILTFAFNIHFILEPIADQTHPKLMKGITEFSKEHTLKRPLFVSADDVAFYLGSPGRNIKHFANSTVRNYAERIGYSEQGHLYFSLNDPIVIEELKKKGGSVVTLYYPLKYSLEKNVERQKENQYLENNCKLLKSIAYRLGRADIWEC